MCVCVVVVVVVVVVGAGVCVCGGWITENVLSYVEIAQANWEL